jgi:hypothetical protein
MRRTNPPLHPDNALIERHGGVKRFAQALKLDVPHAAQLVSNWRRRGIPSHVKCAHPAMFFAAAAAADQASTAAEPSAA